MTVVSLLCTVLIPVIIVEFHPTTYTVNEADEAAQFELVRRTQTSKTVMVLFSTAQLSVSNAATSKFIM